MILVVDVWESTDAKYHIMDMFRRCVAALIVGVRLIAEPKRTVDEV